VISAPPFCNDPSALVVVDWSWWLNKAFRVAGLDGMTSTVVGWLCALLSYDPAHVAIALDSQGPTFRHRMEHPRDPAWRYKSGRDPKPADFFTLSRTCTDLAELHAIPALWAEGFEADDVIATVTRQARAAGYRVWICSADKDLHGLTEAGLRGDVDVGMWDNVTGETRGPVETRAKFGVEPVQIADLLAIAGDAGDSVPGVPGMGPGAASLLLRKFGSLEQALGESVESVEILDAQIKAAGKAIKSGPEKERPLVTQLREQMKERKRLAKCHGLLVEHAEIARFSRALTSLDCDAPIRVPWDDLPMGGFDAVELRKRYLSLGFSRKAEQVERFPKRQPWAVGYEEA
jgi:5'-3' exonuclease